MVILVVISENKFGGVWGKGKNKKNITQMIKNQGELFILTRNLLTRFRLLRWSNQGRLFTLPSNLSTSRRSQRWSNQGELFILPSNLLTSRSSNQGRLFILPSKILSLNLVEMLMFGWYFEVDAWSWFWRWNLIKICVWIRDITSRSYFGKMNSILGSVVPLAIIFSCPGQLNKWPCQSVSE